MSINFFSKRQSDAGVGETKKRITVKKEHYYLILQLLSVHLQTNHEVPRNLLARMRNTMNKQT